MRPAEWMFAAVQNSEQDEVVDVDLLFEVHRWTGYVLFLVILVVALAAFRKARDSREFESGVYRIAGGLLALQVLLGLALYGMEGYWDAAPLIAYVHPLLGLAALGVAQAMVARARKTQMAVDAHRLAGRGFVISLVLLAAGIGVSSMA